MDSVSKNSTLELEILTFKQRGGENLKDTLYGINGLHDKSQNKCSTSVVLRNFYIGMLAWFRYVVHTIIGGNFLGGNTLDALSAIEGLVGAPPIGKEPKQESIGTIIMERLE